MLLAVPIAADCLLLTIRWRCRRLFYTAVGGHHFAASRMLNLYQQYPSVAPERSTQLVRRYTRAFFDRHLRGRPAPLLDGPSPRCPEVEFRWAKGS